MTDVPRTKPDSRHLEEVESGHLDVVMILADVSPLNQEGSAVVLINVRTDGPSWTRNMYMMNCVLWLISNTGSHPLAAPSAICVPRHQSICIFMHAEKQDLYQSSHLTPEKQANKHISQYVVNKYVFYSCGQPAAYMCSVVIFHDSDMSHRLAVFLSIVKSPCIHMPSSLQHGQ